MPRREMPDVSPAIMIAAASYSADTTPPAVDLAQYEGCTIVLAIGAGGITFSGTNKVEFVLTESDDDSSYAAVAAEDVIGAPIAVVNGIIFALTAAHAAASVREIGYKGRKRYLKLLADFSGTHGSPTPISATALRGLPLGAA